MKSKHFIIVLILSGLIVISCNKKSTNEVVKTDISFENVFLGHIDSLRFLCMNLNVVSNEIKGEFFDTSNAFTFKISGEFSGDSSFYLREFDSLGNQTGLFNGKMSDNYLLSGIWMKADSSLKTPFSFQLTQIDASKLFEEVANRFQKQLVQNQKNMAPNANDAMKATPNFHINDLIKLKQNFKADGKQGVKEVIITAENIYRFDFDKVKVKIDYYKSNGVQVKTAEVIFVGLTKNKSESMRVSDDNKANYIVARIIEAESIEAKYYFNHYSQMFNK